MIWFIFVNQNILKMYKNEYYIWTFWTSSNIEMKIYYNNKRILWFPFFCKYPVSLIGSINASNSVQYPFVRLDYLRLYAS